MTQADVRRLALVLSVQAEIEGMKSENMLREQNNESPAYGSEHFNDMSRQLQNWAYAPDDQL